MLIIIVIIFQVLDMFFFFGEKVGRCALVGTFGCTFCEINLILHSYYDSFWDVIQTVTKITPLTLKKYIIKITQL